MSDYSGLELGSTGITRGWANGKIAWAIMPDGSIYDFAHLSLRRRLKWWRWLLQERIAKWRGAGYFRS